MPKMIITYHVLSDEPDPKKHTLTVIQQEDNTFRVELTFANSTSGSFTWFTAYTREEALKPFVEWVYKQEELGNLYEVVVKTEEK